MKKSIIAGLGMFLVASGMADTFYLHADMPLGSTPLDDTIWFTEPVGGVDKATDGGTYGGNRFDLNGYALRTPNTTGSSSFSGTIVSGAAGAGLAELMAGTWNPTGMDLSNTLQMRLRQSTVNLNIANLVLGSSGSLNIRTLTSKNNFNLSVANVSGSGSLEFGDNTYANDTNGVWSLSITDASPEFAGSVDLTRGQLTFGNAFALNDATLAINSAEDNSIVLANNVSFSNVTFGASSLSVGTYTAAELNTAFSADLFSGTETLTVIPEPATLGLLGVFSAGLLLVRRHFCL